jgi:N-formylglutamate amidohydrolase
VPKSALELLEDRLVDRLVWRAVADGASAIAASVPRAEIDLNRDEREIDPNSIAPPLPTAALVQSSRLRGGLGLIPTRLAGHGRLWHGPLPRDELARRIETVHRPYHAALETALQAARRRFGIAVLLDCHSMPPRGAANEARIVLGDRHGTSCAPRLIEAAMAAGAAHGQAPARNQPYAGGYVVARHGRPEQAIHALQIEVDRALYLDESLREPGPGFDSVALMLAGIVEALVEAALDSAQPLAAE